MTTRRVGRPALIDRGVLDKLEEVFSLGGTDKEACLFAGINPATLYNYQEIHPEFVERKAMLKENPVLLARRTIVNNLETDVATSRWYVERRDKDFNQKQEVDVTTQGEKITTGESVIATIAAQAAAILKESDTNPTTASGT